MKNQVLFPKNQFRAPLLMISIRFFTLCYLIITGACFYFCPLNSLPKKVIIIRHADKTPKHYSLNVKGLERAAALPFYFANTPLYNTPPISFVFAASLKGPIETARTYQTCKPTADYYQIPINTTYRSKDTKKLAQEILKNPKYNASCILLCWTHGYIDDIVRALGGEPLEAWTHNIFDQVYVMTFDQNKKPRVQKVLQKLMFGDRP